MCLRMPVCVCVCVCVCVSLSLSLSLSLSVCLSVSLSLSLSLFLSVCRMCVRVWLCACVIERVFVTSHCANNLEIKSIGGD